MGKRTTAANDEAKEVVAGSFSATGTSTPKALLNSFNIWIWGTFAATIGLERSFDGGTTWVPVARDTAGNLASYTAPVSLSVTKPEPGVLYRLNCSTYTSGTANYRLSQ